MFLVPIILTGVAHSHCKNTLRASTSHVWDGNADPQRLRPAESISAPNECCFVLSFQHLWCWRQAKSWWASVLTSDASEERYHFYPCLEVWRSIWQLFDIQPGIKVVIEVIDNNDYILYLVIHMFMLYKVCIYTNDIYGCYTVIRLYTYRMYYTCVYHFPNTRMFSPLPVLLESGVSE